MTVPTAPSPAVGTGTACRPRRPMRLGYPVAAAPARGKALSDGHRTAATTVLPPRSNPPHQDPRFSDRLRSGKHRTAAAFDLGCEVGLALLVFEPLVRASAVQA